MRDGITNEFRLVERDQAVVSVFDSNFLVGDGIWVRSPALYKYRVLWWEGVADEGCFKYRKAFARSTAAFSLQKNILIAFFSRHKPCIWI